jgi:hypothetical protein
MRLNFTIGCALLFLQSFAQTATPTAINTNQEKIKNDILAYFHYDREVIHVQFNKNIYVNNENIAFKGYVFSKNNSTPHSNTTNMELVIYNDQQQIVQKQLFYTEKGIFSGGIHLNDKFKAGKYYFRFFTNWMNNFKEDDSFTQTIEVIDKRDAFNLKSNEPNWKSAQITLTPESGIIVADVTNNIGVAIKDCNNKGIEVKDCVVLDSKSNEITRFNTNKMGYGNFYLNPDLNEKYTIKINSFKLTLSQELPKTQETGLVLTYNNNLSNNKLAVAIKTNEKGLALNQNKKFTLLIHQDSNSIMQQFNFDNTNTEKVLLFDKKLLSNGVNSIRLIDENLNEIAERLVYVDYNSKPITTLEAKVIANDSIQLIGKTDVNQTNLSINILPEDNVCLNQNRSILGTFYLNAYLEKPEIDNYVYFDSENKDKKQEMELLMLNQKRSKYLWENIKSNPPKIMYTFDRGVTINGKVEKELKPSSKFKISLISIKDNVFEDAPIDEKNNFKFENFYAKDSTVFLLQMINEKNMTIKTNMEARVYRNESPLILPLQINNTSCTVEKNAENSFVFTKPKTENSTIDLGEVVVKNNYKKDVFTHKNDMSLNATAYKIGDNDFGNVLDFLNMHGYQTGIDPEENNVYIRSNRSAFSLSSNQSPTVYIDNLLEYDLNLLFNIYMQDVDEIYIDKTGASDTTMGGNGTIKIFLKANRVKNEYFNIKYTTLIVTKGFANNIAYKPPVFDTQKEYFYFGTLNWTPVITPKDNAPFEIKFPRGSQKQIRVMVEGFTPDGQLISEMKKIPVEQ